MTDYNRESYTTDVLVIGGGIAAVFAATRAMKNGAQVIVVDKGSIGRSGQTPFASAMGIFDEDMGDDRETWHKNMTENAYEINNPAYLDNFMDYSKEIYQEIQEWGATEIGFGAVFRSKVIDSGATVIERTMITNLLEDGGKVLGAVGFKLDSETAVVIKAKSVIMCTGAGGFKPSGFQVCSLTFDGDAMAYRIGARISGKEFVDTHVANSETPAYCWGGWSGMWAQGLPVINNPLIEGGGQALDLTEYHNIHENGVSDTSSMMGGRPEGMEGEDGERSSGPSADGEDGDRPSGPPADGEDGDRPSDPPEGMEEGEMPEGEPPSGGHNGSTIGGASAGLSVHKAEGLFPTDGKCATDIPGLYAAGDCLASMLVGPSYNGCKGFSSTGSATQGAAAGEAAATYSQTMSDINIGDSQVDSIIEAMFQPLNNEQGYAPGWVEHMLQGTLIPYYVLFIKEEARLQAALTSIEFFRDQFADSLRATDLHGLRKAHEVKNMILNAEMKLRSSLYRTESRGNHYREDYPDSSDSDWLAWVTIKQGDDGSMELDKFYRKDFVA